jgi:hypothetical protein
MNFYEADVFPRILDKSDGEFVISGAAKRLSATQSRP